MNLLFDLDGTLTDPYEGITRCISHALDRLDRPSPSRMDLRWCILREESIASSDALMFGDREHDMIGAKANGVSGFGVLWGYGTQDELEASGARACLSHPREMSAVFDTKSSKAIRSAHEKMP